MNKSSTFPVFLWFLFSFAIHAESEKAALENSISQTLKKGSYLRQNEVGRFVEKLNQYFDVIDDEVGDTAISDNSARILALFSFAAENSRDFFNAKVRTIFCLHVSSDNKAIYPFVMKYRDLFPKCTAELAKKIVKESKPTVPQPQDSGSSLKETVTVAVISVSIIATIGYVISYLKNKFAHPPQKKQTLRKKLFRAGDPEHKDGSDDVNLGGDHLAIFGLGHGYGKISDLGLTYEAKSLSDETTEELLNMLIKVTCTNEDRLEILKVLKQKYHNNLPALYELLKKLVLDSNNGLTQIAAEILLEIGSNSTLADMLLDIRINLDLRGKILSKLFEKNAWSELKKLAQSKTCPEDVYLAIVSTLLNGNHGLKRDEVVDLLNALIFHGYRFEGIKTAFTALVQLFNNQDRNLANTDMCNWIRSNWAAIRQMSPESRVFIISYVSTNYQFLDVVNQKSITQKMQQNEQTGSAAL